MSSFYSLRQYRLVEQLGDTALSKHSQCVCGQMGLEHRLLGLQSSCFWPLCMCLTASHRTEAWAWKYSHVGFGCPRCWSSGRALTAVSSVRPGLERLPEAATLARRVFLERITSRDGGKIVRMDTGRSRRRDTPFPPPPPRSSWDLGQLFWGNSPSNVSHSGISFNFFGELKKKRPFLLESSCSPSSDFSALRGEKQAFITRGSSFRLCYQCF